MSPTESAIGRSAAERLQVIGRLARALVSTTVLDQMLPHIVEAVGRVLEFDDCILYLWNRSRRKLVQCAAFGPKVGAGGEILNRLELGLGEGIVGWVALSQVAEVIPDVRLDPRYVSDVEGGRSEITVPIVYRGSLIGIIDAESFTQDAFDQDDLAILTTFADLCASAMMNLRQVRNEQNETRRTLESTEARYRDVVEQSSDLIYTTNADGKIDYVNAASEALLGLGPSAMIGRPVTDFVPEGAREGFEACIDHLRAGSANRSTVEVPMIGHDESQVPTEQTISVTRAGSNGRVVLVGFQAIVRDVTRKHELHRSLTYLANHDPLTGLLSRRGLEAELDSQWNSRSREREECVLLMADVDRFKSLNDGYGHAAGDAALRRITAIFKEHTRHDDVVARLGGDEFVLLLRDCTVDSAVESVRRITESVHSTVSDDLDIPVPVSLSVGVAARRLSDHYPEDLMARADEALYAAKLAGRNTYRVHRDELGTLDGTDAFNEDREELEHGLVDGRFDLYAQPILDLAAGRVARYELLLRYNSRSGTVVQPADVLAVAERSTLIRKIDRWVVQKAVEVLNSGVLPAGAAVEVNLSSRAFHDPELLDSLETSLNGLRPGSPELVVQTTEASAVADLEVASAFIARLEHMGCRFAIDDFGIGYSSFKYLKNLPADHLKIDGSFIQDLPTSPVDQHLVQCIVGVAKGLGKKTTAECVDKRETLVLLRQLGVDFAQGNYIGEPRPIGDGNTTPESHGPPVRGMDWSERNARSNVTAFKGPSNFSPERGSGGCPITIPAVDV